MTDKQQNHYDIIQFIQTPLTQRKYWHDNNYDKVTL